MQPPPVFEQYKPHRWKVRAKPVPRLCAVRRADETVYGVCQLEKGIDPMGCKFDHALDLLSGRNAVSADFVVTKNNTSTTNGIQNAPSL